MLGLDIPPCPARAFALKKIFERRKILMANHVKNPPRKKKVLPRSVPSLSLAKILEADHSTKKLLMGEIRAFSRHIDRASIIPTIEIVRSPDSKLSSEMTEIIIKGLHVATEKLDPKKDSPILKYFQRTIIADADKLKKIKESETSSPN
jgi:hypothetical protein